MISRIRRRDSRRSRIRRADIGVWEIFLPDIGAGRSYKFAILGPDGTLQPLKADPFAFQSELRPQTASITTAPSAHNWGDAAHRDS